MTTLVSTLVHHGTAPARPEDGGAVDWPTLLGGPLDGESPTWPRRGRTAKYLRVEGEAPAPVDGKPSPMGPSYAVLVYTVREVPFHATNRRVLRVRVQAWHRMTEQEVAWQLLCRGLGVPEVLR